MLIVYQDTFKRLHKLHVLVIAKMEVKTIEDDTFEDLVQLSQLDLRDHKLISLPQNLFKPMGKLIKLDLSEGQISSLPNLTGLPKSLEKLSIGKNQIQDISGIINMGITWIRTLILGHNNIRRLPAIVFQTIQVLTLDLSNNKLKSLESHSFTAYQGYLAYLALSNNQLTYISASAFKGLTNLNTLFLFGNNIGRIHPNAFQNMSIMNLFLYSNSISEMPAIWENMKKPPSKVFLFDNPLTKISHLTIQGMQIYLSCNKLQKIEVNSSFSCIHSGTFDFKLPTGRAWRDLEEQSGYSCTQAGHAFIVCKPCPAGYFRGPGQGRKGSD